MWNPHASARSCSSSRRGFSLIELLVVMAVIGILAALAIPKLSKQKEKSVIAAMQSDLHNLALAQESYFSEHQFQYAPDAAALSANWRSSDGVTITFDSVSTAGWSAQAVAQGTTRTCRIRIGGGTQEGAPVCQ